MRILSAILIAALVCSAAAGQGDQLRLADFDPCSRGRWETESFQGETEYELGAMSD